MDKTRALKLLGDLQLDLVKRKKGIESKKEKLVQRKAKIMDNVKYHGGNPSSSAARELEHLKKDISYFEYEMARIQEKIDAIKFARTYLKEWRKIREDTFPDFL